jgi:CubicO group peptidase (beta-lactamase class C family)
MSHFKSTKKPRFVLAVLFLVGLGIYLAIPTYVINAIQHGNPGLNDYHIFENRKVRAGKPDPWKLSQDLNKVNLLDSLQEQLEHFKPIAFLVIKNGEIIYEKYWEDYSENSLSNSFSVAKSIVGLLVGIAIDEGHIDSLDQSVGDFLPEFASEDMSKITLRDLLTMSSGTNWDEAYSNLNSITTQAYYGDNLRALVTNLQLVETPGVRFNYQSGNTEILAMVLNRATGKTLSEYASEKLWRKIGATHDAWWSLDKKDGIEKAFCCFNTNARDFARIGQLILNKGKWNQDQVVSEAYIEETIQPAHYLIDEKSQPVDFYGLHWWVIHDKNRQIPYMRGILGQYIFAIPDEQAVVVRLGHERSSVYRGEHTEDIYLYLNIADHILSQYN